MADDCSVNNCFRSKPVRLPVVSFTFQQKPLTVIVVVIVFSSVYVLFMLYYCISLAGGGGGMIL